MKVAYLVARYGAEVIGGAELATRRLAENLAASGHHVEVYTTCAEQMTWADHYPPGTTEVNGVTVHRFRSSARHRDFDILSGPILADPTHCSERAADRLIDWQGPRCPDALDAVAASDADVVGLSPYLYWPTVHGVRRLGDRTVLHPASHDEHVIHLPPFQEVFTRVGGLAYYTEVERRLTERLFPRTAILPQAVVGLGVDVADGSPEDARRELRLGERPYLIYVGRLDDQKGTTFLATWFAAYKQRRPGPLALVLAGQVHSVPTAHPDIVTPGEISERLKWGALRGATALVNPSPYESFSLQVIEAWAVGTPVVVNARCAATVYHCRRSGGGLAFDSYAAFEAAVDRLSRQPGLAQRLGDAGRVYVDAHYRWPDVTRRYARLLASVAERHRSAKPTGCQSERSRGPERFDGQVRADRSGDHGTTTDPESLAVEEKLDRTGQR